MTKIIGTLDNGDATARLAAYPGPTGWQIYIGSNMYVTTQCVPSSVMGAQWDAQLSTPAGWTTSGAGEQDAALYPFMTSMCAIAGFQGPMPDAQHQVDVGISWPNWDLATVNTTGAAMCLNLGAGGRTNVNANWWSQHRNAPDQRLIAVADGICMITHLQGDTSGSEDVGVNIYSDGTYWMLYGGSGNGVNADVSCYRFPGR
jgi:hypothetical protein